jgi:hypothetical protein
LALGIAADPVLEIIKKYFAMNRKDFEYLDAEENEQQIAKMIAKIRDIQK